MHVGEQALDKLPSVKKTIVLNGGHVKSIVWFCGMFRYSVIRVVRCLDWFVWWIVGVICMELGGLCGRLCKNASGG